MWHRLSRRLCEPTAWSVSPKPLYRRKKGDVHSKTTARYGKVHVLLPSVSPSVRTTKSLNTPSAPAWEFSTSNTTFQSGNTSTVSRCPSCDCETREEENNIVPGCCGTVGVRSEGWAWVTCVEGDS